MYTKEQIVKLVNDCRTAAKSCRELAAAKEDEALRNEGAAEALEVIYKQMVADEKAAATSDKKLEAVEE